MPTLRLQICLLLLQFTSHVHGKLSNLQRCADPQCQEAIAVARTTVKYQPDYEGGLFFPNNAVATIYSKDAGSNPDLWGVEINGKRGYAPKRFLREDRVMVPYESLKHIVPVDSSSLLSKNDKNKITIDQKIDEVRTIDNLTADENEETDGGEEFHDDGGDEEEDLDGIQTYAESNSLSNTKQEQPALEAKQEQPALAAQPFVAEAKPEEHRTATEGTFSSSARDASADISASSVDFEIVDGTTIMVDPVDTTLPTPAYLPDYETPPPVHANIPNTVHATTPTPLLSPSAQTVMPLTGAGVDGSSTPELQMVPSDLSLSSSEFRNTPATATPAPAASSPVVNSIDKSTSDTEHSGTVVPSDISNPETASVDSDSTGTTSKGEVAGDEAKPDKNDFNLLNGSDIKLNVAASTNEQNDAGVDAASVGVESNSLPSRDNYPSVQQDSVPISPMPKSEPSDVEFNIDHPIDGHNSVSKDDVVRGEAVDGATSEGAKSDHTISDVEGKTSESGDHIPDDETEDGGSLFDVWLSGWSSTEDGGDTTGGAYQEAPEQSSVMSEPGEQSNLDYSGDGVVDGMPNSVGEVNFNTAADQVTERESSSSFDTTTEQVPTTTTGAAAVAGISNSNEGSAVVQQSTGYSGDGGAMSGSETASDSVAAVDAQLLDDGGALGDVSTSSPIPELRDPGLEPGKEDLDFHNSVIENSVSGLSNLVTDVPESFADVSNLLIDDLEPVTESSEPLIKASELFNEASPLNDDSTLGLSEFDPMPDNSKSADQLPSEEMVSNELPADTANAMIDSSGDISGEALVVGDGAVPPVKSDAPDTLALDPAGDSSDLHDPESLTGHLLKTVEPIVQLMTGSSQLGESLSLALEHDLSSPLAASGAFAAVVIVALTILLLYLASALVTKCSREGPLLKALNVLEHEQHISEQLIADLQSKLSTSHGQLQTVTEAGIADGSEVARVMAQLQQVQEENVTLVERMQDLEQQLEESTNSGLEMDNMLQELLHSQKDTASFQEAIDSLQLMLDSQREKVESLTADLSMKTTLNEELRGESVTAKERIRKLEYQLDQVTQSLEEVNSAKAQVAGQLAAQQSQLQQVTEERDALVITSRDTSAALAALTEQHSRVESKARQLHSTVKTKEAELQVTKECLKQLKVFNDGKATKDKLAQLLDSIKARSDLVCAVEERRSLEAELQQRKEQLAQLEHRLQQVQQEAEQYKRDQTSADQEKREALSKLAVLTDYFHEKEAQLTKELESESGLRLDAEGSAESITSRIRDYDMQLLAYKTQVNTLKKELEDQELSFKTQLAAQEQKAHESWVSARAAERKYEESKQETAQMRSRLLVMSKGSSEQQQHSIIKPTPQHAETSNGSVSSPRPPLHDDLDGEHSHPLDSPPPIPPPHMLPHLFPPPPGIPPPFPPHFLPPPLPPPMMADRRLPPAGRLASPPFHRRMGAASPPEFLDRRSPPHFDRRSYSPASERSRYSDRQGRYSPDRHGRYSPDRHGRYSPDRQGRYSPDRQGRYSPDRQRRYSPDRLYDRHPHNDRYNNIDRHSDAYSSNGRNDSQRDSSPERPYNRSPEGFARKASPPPLPRRLYEEGGGPPTRKGKKTSTPVGPNDR